MTAAEAPVAAERAPEMLEQARPRIDVRAGQGSWTVAGGPDGTFAVHRRQADAVDAARALAQRIGGAVVAVENRRGQVREAWEIPGAPDLPFPASIAAS